MFLRQFVHMVQRHGRDRRLPRIPITGATANGRPMAGQWRWGRGFSEVGVAYVVSANHRRVNPWGELCRHKKAAHRCYVTKTGLTTGECQPWHQGLNWKTGISPDTNHPSIMDELDQF